MQVQTTDGITITLTDEQIAQIDSQVKAKQVPMSIMDRVKSWEDAFTIIKPKFWPITTGGAQSENTPESRNGKINVSSKKRALSLLAYAQLSVIADALNEGWEPDWKGTGPKYFVYYFYPNQELKPSPAYSSRSVAIYFKSSELANYTITQFPDLWKQFFMID